MVRVAVKPELIRWAINRSGVDELDLTKQFPKLNDWSTGKKEPTLKQLEDFAKITLTPFGYFFLKQPPVETLPLHDYRTLGDVPIDRPSPNLISTIQTMKMRQDWMREYLVEEGYEQLKFVGSAKQSQSVENLASKIREELRLDPEWARKHSTWDDALRALRKSADQIGILISFNGKVGNNTHRPLNPEEFRGFVLCDSYAPLIFVNGADSKSAQMFTLAHELSHVWLGKGGLFNLIKMMPSQDSIELLCNRVAAELLVPKKSMLNRWRPAKTTETRFQNIQRMSRLFKVSPLVVARRALDLDLISKRSFFQFYKTNQDEWKIKKVEQKKKGGGDFYRNQDTQLGRRFALAVIRSVDDGSLLYRDAFKLTDLKGSTFDRFTERCMKQEEV